jgi:hypothetical protein
MKTGPAGSGAADRRGITLTEILIAIMILGIGLVSLATLFPIGLLRLRDATRYSRTAYLSESGASDMLSRSLLSSTSFYFVPWYTTAPNGPYNPFIQDTAADLTDWAQLPGAYAGVGGLGLPPATQVAINGLPAIPGLGLPFAYDPLWRYQTVNAGTPQANGPAPIPPGGYYNGDPGYFEARFGSGIGFIRDDPSGVNTNAPSAHGLQRITNFNRPFTTDAAGNPVPVMPAALNIPDIFVSPEDVVWQETSNQNYPVGGNPALVNPPAVGTAPSPVVPDLSIIKNALGKPLFQTITDWRYSWMFTGQLTNAGNQACFDGNVVIFENRRFGIETVNGINGATPYQVEGETVVEGIFGHSGNIVVDPNEVSGYATGADRTVLLRWNAMFPDPTVKPGDWIADVTYERNQLEVQARWWKTNAIPVGIANLSNNGEWDNLPAQRCFWYQVQKVVPAIADPYLGAQYRSMVVYVNQSLQSRTPLAAAGQPAVINAALICPYVVNVIPRTIFTR